MCDNLGISVLKRAFTSALEVGGLKKNQETFCDNDWDWEWSFWLRSVIWIIFIPHIFLKPDGDLLLLLGCFTVLSLLLLCPLEGRKLYVSLRLQAINSAVLTSTLTDIHINKRLNQCSKYEKNIFECKMTQHRLQSSSSDTLSTVFLFW